MPDTILQGTLPNMPSGFAMPAQQEIPYDPNNKERTPSVKAAISTTDQNISSLQAAQSTPQQLASFQKIMSLSSRTAFKERQAQELGNMGFDPSKVSGSTFSDIIGGLTKNRTEDTQKVYGANMGVYRGIQNEIQNRIKYLQDLQQDKAEYMLKYSASKKGASKKQKKQIEEAKTLFNRSYVERLQLAGKDTAYMDFSAAEIQQSIKSLADQNYAYEQVHGALLQEGIPVFPGSMAADYLGSIFK